ncbi:biotin/lipoyl-binding protein [Rhodobacter aestuarii]|uniref:Biotin-lipoyl like n=1 Tax=Rhodobacter aestuarii TaxID=453582 RepID=A0A1N7NGD8_9RHOB|nr:HlyD family efflux transporter periplasmic adaptor subunit [Rhodobacter aestuarii]PTV96457.1 biotin/lipoyl-binding protein [Rhodobacter aestuarii]SIS97463.1 Biotin-lipoyl like [Rhodobacter aestuarii]
MKSINRAAFGVAIWGISLALLLVAGNMIYSAATGPRITPPGKTPRERAYSVTVAPLVAQEVTPIITAYGLVESGRSLELRSAVAGTVVELSPNFRDGGAVAAGELLFRIDPARLESAVALAANDLREAEAELAEAGSALELARMEAAVAQEQRDIRAEAATRQKGLADRGVSTAADLEAAKLAKAAAEQTWVNRLQIVAGDEARLAQAKITLDRRKIALADAERALRDATVSAPFAGQVTEVAAVEGRLVSANEKLASLLDPAALEVAFRVTNTQFSRLLNGQGNLRKAEVTIRAQSGQQSSTWQATLERAGAETGTGQVGRLVYARLVEPDPTQIRPGDFVSVEVAEKPLSNVAMIPAAAASADGRILLLGEGNRLEEVQAKLLRQQGDRLIVGEVPFGRSYVERRALQLGAGIQVTPVGPPPAPGAAPAPAPEAETVTLNPERRAKIIAFIEASATMKPEMREKFLEELSREAVPRATVEKFEAKMAESQ